MNLPAIAYGDLVLASAGSGARPTRIGRAPGVRWMWAFADLQECRANDSELHALRWLRELAAADVVEDLCWRRSRPEWLGWPCGCESASGRGAISRAPAQIAAEG